MVTNLISWLTKLIKKNYKPIQMFKKRRYPGELKLGQITNLTQLDGRYWKILLFINLKLFRHYSKMVQWISNEQKVIIK